MFVTPAYAQAAGGGGAGAIAQFIPLILIFGIMYFLMIRPQQKRMKQHRAMVAALQRNDKVVTQGGILGKVTNVTDEEVEIEIAQGVRIRVVRSTIAQVINPIAAANTNK